MAKVVPNAGTAAIPLVGKDLMELTKAKAIAEKYLQKLKPFCKRAEIAGSIRREKLYPKDIEICIIPDTSKLLQLKQLVDQWPKIKGEVIGRYTQRILPEGLKLDLFICTEENWGLNFAIRTGSARFSHEVLAKRWTELGYKSKNAILQKDGRKYPLREEIDVFNFLKLDWVPPKMRE